MADVRCAAARCHALLLRRDIQCLALTADWTQAERDALRHEVPLHGLRTRFRGATLKELSQQVTVT